MSDSDPISSAPLRDPPGNARDQLTLSIAPACASNEVSSAGIVGSESSRSGDPEVIDADATQDQPDPRNSRAECPLASGDASLPVKLVGYELISEVGRGGMGVVFRARDLVLDREVAIKFLRIDYGVDSSVARRFMNEARITGQLQHPGIPPIHQIGNLADGRPYLVMKLIKGRTLQELLDDRSPGGPNLIAVFEAICQTVGYAHAHQVIHRDLKPANVMVGGFGEVQVMDWGLAKVLTPGMVPSPEEQTDKDTVGTEIRTNRDLETVAGSMIGTPAYMPPEQAVGELERVDQRSDVFGLGGILCAILTGQPPYTEKSKEAMRVAALRGKLDDANARLDDSGAEPGVIALAKRCLSFEPGDRPADAGMLAQEVAKLRADAEEGFRAAEVERTRAEVLAIERERRLKRLHWLVAASFVVLLGVGALGFFAWQAKNHAEKQEAIANENAIWAGNEARRADKESDEAKLQKQIALQEASVATRQLIETERVLDLSKLREANTAFENNMAAQARETLAEIHPKNRCVAWGILNRHLEGGLFTLYGHTNGLTDVAISADCSRIVTCSLNNTVKVWNGRTGELLFNLNDANGIFSASINSDGTRIVTRSSSPSVTIWDATTGLPLRAINGHAHGVSCCAISPDGKRIVTGSSDGTLKLWDAGTANLLSDFAGHKAQITCTAMSEDGTRIITGSHDKTAKLWDARTGKMVRDFKVQNSVISVAISGDGARAITVIGSSGKLDFQAKVWDAQTEESLFELKEKLQLGSLNPVAISADGTRIVTGSMVGTPKVWDAKTGELLLVLRGHAGIVRCVAISADATRIVSGCDDKTAKVWDATTGQAVPDLREHSAGGCVAISADGARIVTGSDTSARVWDAATGRPVVDLLGHSALVTQLAISADGRRIVTGSRDRTAKLWDARTGKQLRDFTGHKNHLTSVAISADGALVITASEGVGRVWDAGTGQPILDLSGHTDLVAISADGSRIVTASRSSAQVLDAKTGQQIRELREPIRSSSALLDGIRSLSINADGTRIVTGIAAVAKLWDGSTGQLLFTLNGHSLSGKLSVAISADGTRIVTGSADHTAKVWDGKTGQVVLDLKGHTEAVNCVAISADGTRIVTATGIRGNSAKLWDGRVGQSVHFLTGHVGWISDVVVSADGTRVVTGATDNTAKVWDARTHQMLLDLRGHTDRVDKVAISADGTRIATGSNDKTTRIWDARTGQLLFDLKGLTSGVASVAISSDGTRVATATYGRTIKIWNGKTGEWLFDLMGASDLVNYVVMSSDDTRIVAKCPAGTSLQWDLATGRPIANEPIPKLVVPSDVTPDGWFQFIALENRVMKVPTHIDEDKRLRRLWLTRPDPLGYQNRQRELTAERNFYGAALHREYEERARGLLAFESGEVHKAYAHFVAAACLRDNPIQEKVFKTRWLLQHAESAAARQDGEAAKNQYSEAIDLLHEIEKIQTGKEELREQLSSAHAGRASLLLSQFNRPAEAAIDYEQAAHYADDRHRGTYRIFRARALAKIENLDPKTMEEIAEQARSEKAEGDCLYNLACIYALQSASENDKSIKENLARQAIEHLRGAEKAGYFRKIERGLSVKMRTMLTDVDLAALRTRMDFKDFVKSLASKTAPTGKADANSNR